MRIRAIVLTAVVAAVFPLFGTAELQAQESGAELWGRTCTRCHNARAPNERTDREWTTIVQHMRARANLTRSEAGAILEFLQAANAPEAGAVARTAPSKPSSARSETATVANATAPASRASARLSAEELEALIAYLGRIAQKEAPAP